MAQEKPASLKPVADQPPMQCSQRAFAVLQKIWGAESSSTPRATTTSSKATPSRKRRSESLTDKPFDIPQVLEDVAAHSDGSEPTRSTVLYLAYGSNLSAETFLGVRGIKPLSQINVLVPSLALTFDLAGIPYTEPCFANTQYRSAEDSSHTAAYHKELWYKGLVGVVYEVTKADYATIIKTEGGGASYHDVLVDCFEIPLGTEIVDANPQSAPFKAHTLFSPANATTAADKLPRAIGHRQRPDPNYAQPSARYLKLICDGAAEHNLPRDYQEFLHNLQPYTITSKLQRMGQILLLASWVPMIALVLGLGRVAADKNGRYPKWLVVLTDAVFNGVWLTYDLAFKKIFGDGERTQQKKNDVETGAWCLKRKHYMVLGEKDPLLAKT